MSTDASSATIQSISLAARDPQSASHQLALRGGLIVCRSEGLSVHTFSGGSRAEEEDPLTDRLILMTNQRAMPAAEIEQDESADLSFQINNQSAETVTLAQIQVLLLGVIPCYEDQITKPLPPRVAEEIESLTVEQNSPPRNAYADLTAVFADDDTPRQDLQYEILENTNPDVVTATISPQSTLDLSFAKSQFGLAEIVVAAVDPFQLSAKCVFFVEVKPKTPPTPVEVVTVPSMPPSSRPVVLGSEVSDPFAGSSSGVKYFLVEENPMFLGRLVFAYELEAGALVAPCGSGDLLPVSKTEVLPPKRAKSFRVRIGCWTSNKVPEFGASMDSLIGRADRRRRLTVNLPTLEEVHHLVAICIRVNSEDGKSQELYCDHLYRLKSFPRPASPGGATSTLQSGIENRLEETASALLGSLVRSYEETAAYERAMLCGSVPDGFDATVLSLFCYYGDPTSPFRPAPSTSLFSERDRRPRSNAIKVLAGLQRGNPPLWYLIHSQLVQLASSKNELAAKAKALQRELQVKRPARSLVQSLVRVEMRPQQHSADGEKAADPFADPPKPR